MKFSILLPTKDRLDLLRMAIDTVRGQTYQDWEIIVSDNASKVDIRAYVEGLAEPRIRYVRVEDAVPVTDNWNNACNHATGDYVIMLGDDDGLTPGCFETLLQCINAFANPDVIFCAAYHFAYPRVMPSVPEGYLIACAGAPFVPGHAEPFLLDDATRKSGAQRTMQLYNSFGYNMQHYVVAAKFIERMKAYGPFYQSPYPDFYAANAAILEADKFVVLPRPLTIIGISPKSYGFFHFNASEADGVAFLGNKMYQGANGAHEIEILPGSNHNSSWLLAALQLEKNFGHKYNLTADVAQYRRFQIAAVAAGLQVSETKSAASAAQRAMASSLTPEERRYFWRLRRYYAWRNFKLPNAIKKRMRRAIHRASDQHVQMALGEMVRGRYADMSDVFAALARKEAPPLWA